jgi:hypothetical protein
MIIDMTAKISRNDGRWSSGSHQPANKLPVDRATCRKVEYFSPRKTKGTAPSEGVNVDLKDINDCEWK